MKCRRLALLPLAASFAFSCTQTRSDDDPLSKLTMPIVGGETDDGAEAHTAVVLLSVGGGTCTGSLIAPNLVLTARHCVSQVIVDGIACDPYAGSLNGDHVGSDYAPSQIKVFTGVQPDFYWGTPAASGKQLFKYPEKSLCNKDIALVLLDKNVSGITPMPIRLDSPALVGEMSKVVGYGITKTNGWDSGTRRRRYDVPVLTSGLDVNFYCGASEMELGQSTCQGDSGGPVMAMASGAILGVTSRGGSCETASQTFSRVDAHKALIQQALTAAGHTAVAESPAAPTPPAELDMGQGPCTAGAQCKDDYCYGTGASSFCSKLCLPKGCAAGMICLEKTISILGQSMKDFVCVPIPDGTDCEDCRYNTCKAQFEACAQEAKCATAMKCIDKCTDDACRDTCRKPVASLQKYLEFDKCLCSATCGSSCTGMCGGAAWPGTGGSGGAGGSGAGGAAGSPGQGGSPAQGGAPSQGGAAGEGGMAEEGGAAGEGGEEGVGGEAGEDGTPAEYTPSSGDDGGCSVASHAGSSSSFLSGAAWLVPLL